MNRIATFPTLFPLFPLLALCSLPLVRTLQASPNLTQYQERASSQPSPQDSKQDSEQDSNRVSNPGSRQKSPQDSKPAEAQETAANSHVRALLERMLAKNAFALRAKYSFKNPLSALPIPIPALKAGKANKKIKVEVLQIHTPTLDSWSLNGKKANLFRKGSLWAVPIEGSFALANDRKKAENWDQTTLPDGVLLTKSLESLLPLCKWKDLGSDTFDDRPVLVWRCRLKGKPARLFQATGMTQTKTSPFSLLFFVNLPGMKKKKPIDVRLEITLYEDPGHKLPLRVTIRTFFPRKLANQPGRNVIIQIGGQAQQNDDEDEDKKMLPGETKTHKLVSSLEFLFSRWGHIKPKALPPAVEKLLK